MDELNIKGKKYPFLFANRANREMSKCKDLAKKDDVYFLWLGFKYGSILDGKKFPYSEDELVDIFDLNMKLFAEAGVIFAEQMGEFKAAKAPILKVIIK